MDEWPFRQKHLHKLKHMFIKHFMQHWKQYFIKLFLLKLPRTLNFHRGIFLAWKAQFEAPNTLSGKQNFIFHKSLLCFSTFAVAQHILFFSVFAGCIWWLTRDQMASRCQTAIQILLHNETTKQKQNAVSAFWPYSDWAGISAWFHGLSEMLEKNEKKEWKILWRQSS